MGPGPADLFATGPVPPPGLAVVAPGLAGAAPGFAGAAAGLAAGLAGAAAGFFVVCVAKGLTKTAPARSIKTIAAKTQRGLCIAMREFIELFSIVPVFIASVLMVLDQREALGSGKRKTPQKLLSSFLIESRSEGVSREIGPIYTCRTDCFEGLRSQDQ